MNSILEPNVPFKTVHKYKLRTPALQESVFVKKSLINKFKILPSKSTKTPKQKNIIIFMKKRCKMNYYNHYFKTNWDNIKSTWKSIRSILSINNNPSNVPKMLVCNDTKSTEVIEIGNILYIYCLSSLSLCLYLSVCLSVSLSLNVVY